MSWVEVFPSTTKPGSDNVFILYAIRDRTLTKRKGRKRELTFVVDETSIRGKPYDATYETETVM